MHSKVWGEIIIFKIQWLTHWSLGMEKSFHPTLYNECNSLSMLGLKELEAIRISYCLLALLPRAMDEVWFHTIKFHLLFIKFIGFHATNFYLLYINFPCIPHNHIISGETQSIILFPLLPAKVLIGMDRLNIFCSLLALHLYWSWNCQEPRHKIAGWPEEHKTMGEWAVV